MKIHVLSDLHIEFAAFHDMPTDADVTVLAGDIGTGMEAFEFASELALERPVIYVLGNHEYFRDAIPRLTNQMRKAAHGTDLHVLENDEVTIGTTRFLGATLWTDWQLYGPRTNVAMEAAGYMMPDYKLIQRSPEYTKLTPEDTRLLHIESRSWLSDRLESAHEGSTVVVTHHAPCERSSDPKFDGDVLTPAFISRLDDLLGRSQLWIHGHTHFNVDYTVGVFCLS